LLRQIKHNISVSQALSTFRTEEKNRGRFEQRDCRIYGQIGGIDPGWIGAIRIIHMIRSGYRKDTGEYLEHHYYITSHPFLDAETVADGIRKHWWIENKIHHVKDTFFNEDGNGIKNSNASAILSIFQDIAMNIYRCLGFSSIKSAAITFANKINKLFAFLNAKHISNLKN